VGPFSILTNNQFTASLWGDESFAAVLAQKNIFEIVRIVAKDTSPPGYYFFLHFWLKIFGTGEVAIRVLSFLFFVFLAITVYFIGKTLFDNKTGILAALLTFTNQFLFSYGFEGRMYSILALFSTLSVYFFLKRNWPWYIVTTTAALYSHHFAIFVVLVEIIWLIPDFVKNFWKTARPFILISILYLPWLYPLYLQTSKVATDFWLAKPTLQSVTTLFENFSVGSLGNHFLHNPALWLVLLILLLRKWKFFNWQDWFLVSWAILPVVFTFLASYLMKSSIFFDRYMLFIIPAIMLLLASRPRKFVSEGAIILLIIFFAIMSWFYFTHPTKRPFRQLATFVKTTARADEALINFPGKAHHLFESKFYRLAAPIYTPSGAMPFYTGTALMDEKDQITKLPEKKLLGVVTSEPKENVKLEGYQMYESYQFGDLWFLRFERE